MTWTPATRADVERIVLQERQGISQERLALMDQYAVDPYPAIVEREADEQAFVVAQSAGHVVFYEDVEEVFGAARLQDGRLTDCNMYGSLAAAVGVLHDLVHPKPRPAPLPIEKPALLDPAEVKFIKETVLRFFGANAVVRNYGPDPLRLLLHVETDLESVMEKYECAGILMAHIDRHQIDLSVTTRGTKPFGEAKIAYRQGVIL